MVYYEDHSSNKNDGPSQTRKEVNANLPINSKRKEGTDDAGFTLDINFLSILVQIAI